MLSAGGIMIHRLSLLLRIVRARPRLFSAAALGISVTVALGLSTHWWRATCLLAGWDIGVAVYLVLAIFMMACSDIESIRRRASEEDDGQFVILVLTVAAALVSLAAIFIELGTSGTGGSRQPGALILATITIVLSWAFIYTMFALHYAHEFYDESDGRGLTPRRRGRAGLLGLRLLRPRHRNDVSGLRRGSHQQGDPPHGRCPRRGVLLLQRGVARAHGEHRSECHLKHREEALPGFAASALTPSPIDGRHVLDQK